MVGSKHRDGRDGSAGVLAGRERTVAVLLAVGVAVLTTVVTTELFPYHSVNHDEGVYLQQAAMLLDGKLFLQPPVSEVFRPWFFVERPDGGLYSKYAPVPAAMFAVGQLLGSARLTLAAVAAGITFLTYALVAELFDRRRGIVAAALLPLSPLFLVQSGVFLPYAPTTLWNLGFAYAYVRARRAAETVPNRTDSSPRISVGDSPRISVGDSPRISVGDSPRIWAAIAGICVGIAFFARPYTAVLFAAPFVLHAVWTLWAGSDDHRDGDAPRPLFGYIDRGALARQSLTATGGLAGVAMALGYNGVVTGSPLVFPYQAFAPLDGIGFGHREILGYDRNYTVALALRANAEVVWQLFTKWVAGGAAGAVLAAVGVAGLLETLLREIRGGSDRREFPTYRVLLAGTFLTVIAGNVAFWGNLNVLGELADPSDGLIASLGPYYHYDLLVPTAAFAADGLLRSRRRLAAAVETWRGESAGRATAAIPTVTLAVVLVLASVTAAAGPVSRNAAATQTYESAYEPFESGESVLGAPTYTPPEDAVVFLPTPFGDWLNHPFQPLRNDPGFDGEAVYALRERQFAVVDAFPDRRLYRYSYRGEWSPQTATEVDARLQRIHHRAGERVTLSLSFGIPQRVESLSIRLAGADGQTYYAANSTAAGRLPLTLTVTRDRDADDITDPEHHATATLDGPITSVGNRTITLDDHESLQLVVFLDYGTGAGFSYRVTLPTLVEYDEVRTLSPSVEVCRNPTRCDGEAAYIPNETREGVVVEYDLRASNETAANDFAPMGERHTHDAATFLSDAAEKVGMPRSIHAPDRVLGE